MHFQYTISENDMERWANQLGALSNEQGHAALARALNRTVAMAKTQVVRELARASGLPQKHVRNRVQKIDANPNSVNAALKAELYAKHIPIPLSKWKPKQFSWGVRVRVLGETQRHEGAFINKGRFNTNNPIAGKNVFTRIPDAPRLENGNAPIQKAYGPSAGELLGENAVQDAFTNSVNANLARRVSHELGRLLKE